jgi:hypothetical protein
MAMISQQQQQILPTAMGSPTMEIDEPIWNMPVGGGLVVS